MAWIDTLRAAVMGTPPAADHKPSREGVVRAAEELSLTVGDLSKQISMTASGVQSYATVANLPTPVPPNGSMARVYADPVAANNTFWLVTGGVWVKDAAFADAVAAVVQPMVDRAEEAADTFSGFLVPGKNLLDKSFIRRGRNVTLGSADGVPVNTDARCSPFIPVVPGATYAISGVQEGMRVAATILAQDTNAGVFNLGQTDASGQLVVTVPMDRNYIVFNITQMGQDHTDFDDTAQLERGNVVTEYEPYSPLIDGDSVFGWGDKLDRSEILSVYSYNMIDLGAVRYTKRYQPSTMKIIDGTGFSLAVTGHIPVDEGSWYTISGPGIYTVSTGEFPTRTGFFTNLSDQGVASADLVPAQEGEGASFYVPTGLGIQYVVITLRQVEEDVHIVNGEVQLERGRNATVYRPYEFSTKIKPSLLPNDPGGGGGDIPGNFDARAWYSFTIAEGTRLHADKLPRFREHYTARDKDLVVVATGSSVSAATTNHCTTRHDAPFRPPMLHTNNWSNSVWEELISGWEGQQYRRYDASDFYTESGVFETGVGLEEWDEGTLRNGLTRYSSTPSASVEFTVPTDAWQFNFIYRTDSVGCDAQVSVTEGNDQIQIWDEDDEEWVEANGYAFTQNEPEPVERLVGIPGITDPSIITPTMTVSKGNTTYQKRLKMRCRGENSAFDTRSTEKTVTIARTGGGPRFMYWGVEWSPRQYMLTFINAARGSHNVNSLARFQDNEVWSFKPDLIFSELAINNSGATSDSSYGRGYWAGLAHRYVTNADYEMSLYGSAARFGLDPEYCFWTGVISSNHSMLNSDGTLKITMQPASSSGIFSGPARMASSLERYEEALAWLESQGIPTINTTKRWVEAARAIYGNLYTATLPSSRTGPTLTNDGTHHNDLGALILAKVLCALLGGVPR